MMSCYFKAFYILQIIIKINNFYLLQFQPNVSIPINVSETQATIKTIINMNIKIINAKNKQKTIIKKKLRTIGPESIIPIIKGPILIILFMFIMIYGNHNIKFVILLFVRIQGLIFNILFLKFHISRGSLSNKCCWLIYFGKFIVINVINFHIKENDVNSTTGDPNVLKI